MTILDLVTKLKDLQRIAQWMKEGTVRAVIDQTFKLEEAPKAFGKLKTGRARGKVVVEVVGALGRRYIPMWLKLGPESQGLIEHSYEVNASSAYYLQRSTKRELENNVSQSSHNLQLTILPSSCWKEKSNAHIRDSAYGHSDNSYHPTLSLVGELQYCFVSCLFYLENRLWYLAAS